MSGFALIFDTQKPITPQDQDFLTLKKSVAEHKGLGSAGWDVYGLQCAAVKFDMPSTLHRGITVDVQSGSWILAAGTVLNSEDDSNRGLGVLLEDYLKLGDGVFRGLDGPFALVIYNKPANKIAVVADPMGFISIFYARRGNRIYVATSALAVAQAVHATPNEYGIYHFLNIGSMYGKTTLWQEVERLSAGTVLEITPSGSTQSVYWLPAVDDEISKLSLSETVEYAFDLLSRLIKQHLKREGSTWVDLTGGFDSRLVTLFMDYHNLPFKASCQGPPDSPDVRISSRIARQLGWGYRHAILPDGWGRERYERFPEALGKGDAHLDLFKLSSVLWDQEQRALEYNTSIWGLGGELWRGTIWKQELWNVGKTRTVNYDRLIAYRVMNPVDHSIFSDASRVDWVRQEVRALLESMGDRYANYPNTVKLDCIFAYKTTGHSGAHISAVMGQQRVLSPLYFKDSVAGAISAHFKWRNHSRLVRLLMERVNPVLASFGTTDGGPALPMRVTNLRKFVPYWSFVGKQLVRKASYAVLGRSLLAPVRDELTSYPLTRWRQETLDCLAQDRVLDHACMHSGRLYNPEHLAAFLEKARTEEFSQEAFLSRIVTVEMALRTVGASV
jgi:asparagine synthase (glutamine-hydrolysing)